MNEVDMKAGNSTPFFSSADAYLNKGGLDQSIFADEEYLNHIETLGHRQKKAQRSTNRKNLFLHRLNFAKGSLNGKDKFTSFRQLNRAEYKAMMRDSKSGPKEKNNNGNCYLISKKPRDIRAGIIEQEQRQIAIL